MGFTKRYAVILFCLFICAEANLAQASVERLSYVLNHPAKFDKKIVILEAEAVGEVLKVKDGAWINILDGGYNIGVYAANPGILKDIVNFGAYGKRGDIVRIRGVFHKDCSLHAGRDIHALSVDVVRKGYLLHEETSLRKRFASFILSIICLTLAVIYFIKLAYERRH